MARTERRTIPVPSGQRVYVVSDLSLSPTTDPTTRPVQEFIDLLGDIDDGALVVVAGNLIYPSNDVDLATFVDSTLRALPQLRWAISTFCAKEGHRLIVLPGSDDVGLRDDESAQAVLEDLGVGLARDLTLQVATANGVRDLAVAAGSYELDVTPVAPRDRADADRLEDPTSLERFVASRVLYRRLRLWVWLPLFALFLADVSSVLAGIIGHFTDDDLSVHLVSGGFWTNFFADLVIVAAAETLLAAFASYVVRRRFNRRSNTPNDALSEHLTLTSVDDEDSTAYARRVIERGGAGAVLGGAPSPALAFLDEGVCATTGPSRIVLVERRGRFGLPPIFSSVDRIGIVEIEAASAVQVRLFSGQSLRPRATMLERLLAERANNRRSRAPRQRSRRGRPVSPFP